MVLCACVPLPGSLGQPADSFFFVGRYADSILVVLSETALGLCIALLRCFGEPFSSAFRIGYYHTVQSFVECLTNPALGETVSEISSLAETIECS